MPYCAESALCCTTIPDKDSLCRIRTIQYNIFACSVIVRENDVASCQDFAGHVLDHSVTSSVVFLKLCSGRRHDEHYREPESMWKETAMAQLWVL